ncbi:unnamed protein product [Protopolystoma xenopodis]|uniref:Uncharacterized protein n=1 Tax=Protopolystoma xenopodis TaxID=117903 RepID=A0A3S5AF27_9PLAT|nr:unnamed protein product [Protopolystoma xenopodis]
MSFSSVLKAAAALPRLFPPDHPDFAWVDWSGLVCRMVSRARHLSVTAAPITRPAILDGGQMLEAEMTEASITSKVGQAYLSLRSRANVCIAAKNMYVST